MLLIGSNKFPSRQNKSELGSDTSLDKVWNFYARSRHHCAGKPVMVSRNVGCSLKLEDDRHHPFNFWARTYYSIRSNYLFKKIIKIMRTPRPNFQGRNHLNSIASPRSRKMLRMNKKTKAIKVILNFGFECLDA